MANEDGDVMTPSKDPMMAGLQASWTACAEIGARTFLGFLTLPYDLPVAYMGMAAAAHGRAQERVTPTVGTAAPKAP